MLTAYSAGESIIGRQIIEEVAENLDLMPRSDAFQASAKPAQKIASSGVLKSEAREELWNNQAKAEAAIKPKKFQSEIGASAAQNANGGARENASAQQNQFMNSDDEINLEIEEMYY